MSLQGICEQRVSIPACTFALSVQVLWLDFAMTLFVRGRVGAYALKWAYCLHWFKDLKNIMIISYISL